MSATVDVDVVEKEMRRVLDAILGEHRSRGAALEDRVNHALEELRATVSSLKQPRDGVDGLAGKDGRSGTDGKEGERGPAGKDGRDGADGRNGADGQNGRDCDMARVEQLVRDLVAAIPRPRDGKDGVDGYAGKDGAPGRDGRDGDRGDRGPAGRDGRDGENGVDGRDASQIEVLDTIVDGRSYARGTWAKRDGGLWRFSGVEWQCVVDGVKSIDVEQMGERTFRVSTTCASGTKSHRDFPINVVIDRGVWESKAYEIGDCVTWDGSMWIAKAAPPETDKPGESSTWRLAVKRGRNGKS